MGSFHRKTSTEPYRLSLTHLMERTVQKFTVCPRLIYGEISTETFLLSWAHFIERPVQKRTHCHWLILWRALYKSLLTVTSHFDEGNTQSLRSSTYLPRFSAVFVVLSKCFSFISFDTLGMNGKENNIRPIESQFTSSVPHMSYESG